MQRWNGWCPEGHSWSFTCMRSALYSKKKCMHRQFELKIHWNLRCCSRTRGTCTSVIRARHAHEWNYFTMSIPNRVQIDKATLLSVYIMTLECFCACKTLCIWCLLWIMDGDAKDAPPCRIITRSFQRAMLKRFSHSVLYLDQSEELRRNLSAWGHGEDSLRLTQLQI